MSRSRPSDITPNPSSRWFEWNGEEGFIKYYDKESGENIKITEPFTFLVLDQLSTVKGWHKPSESAVYSNEVRNTGTDVMRVRSFKGGDIAEGVYKEIRDRVNNSGGKFHASLYIAYKDGEELKIGNLSLKGASLNAWVEFTKGYRSQIYEKAVVITGWLEGVSGSKTYRYPKFELKDVAEETDKAAKELDDILQGYLDVYLAKGASVEEPTNEAPPVSDVDAPPVQDVEDDLDNLPF